MNIYACAQNVIAFSTSTRCHTDKDRLVLTMNELIEKKKNPEGVITNI